jgi:DnaA family protein
VRQLTLNLQLNERVSFDSFIVGDNAQLFNALQNLFVSSEFCWYLWGEQGVGRSHLLQSCAYAANQLQKKVMYIALADHQQLSPDIIRGIEQYDIVIWDDVDAIAGLNEWEVALFHAYNQLQPTGAKIISAATSSPTASHIQLPDLRSRLAAGVTYQVKPLRDEEKLAALQQRAKSRGMHLNDSVGRYLLSHCPRDMSALFSFLDQLDAASLQEKRLLTIPFVKSVLLEAND